MLLRTYSTPLGTLAACCDQQAIRGIWFPDQKRNYSPGTEPTAGESPLFDQLGCWLEDYFSGRDPGAVPPVLTHGTVFQESVWSLLRQIPRGGTVTYGQLAQRLGRPKAAQAVGRAVGRNPVLLLIPCHRVVGADGTLTGYAGGLERKAALLKLEQRPTGTQAGL